jgi:hypothetical protein
VEVDVEAVVLVEGPAVMDISVTVYSIQDN